MAIRSVILNVTATPSIAHILAEWILPGFYTTGLFGGKSGNQYSLDSMDILIDLIKRFGSSISISEIGRIENYLLGIISNEKGIIRKRAVVALGLLSRYLEGNNWQILVDYIIDGLNDDSEDLNKLKSLIQLVGILAKSDPTRFKNDLIMVTDSIIANGLKVGEDGKIKRRGGDGSDEDDLEDENDIDPELLEVREASLSSLEIIVGLGYSAVESQFNDILYISKYFIEYNPNIIEDEEEEEEEEDDDDGDVEMDEDEEINAAADDENFDLSDEDDVFSDDDDQSWKLRRFAVRLAAALADSIPNQLPRIYSQLLPSLIKRYSSEQEPTVKEEIIASLNSLFEAASEGGLYYSSSKLTKNTSDRRLSDISMAAASDLDPRTLLRQEYLAKLVRISLKELGNQSTSIAISQNIISNILTTLIRVLPPLPINLVKKIVNTSATLSKSKPALLPDILQLISALFKNHGRVNELTYLLPQLLSIIVLGINDKYYKVNGAALDVVLDVIGIYGEREAGGSEGVDDEEDISIDEDENAKPKPSIDISILLPGIIEKAKTASLDLETRDKSVRALGQFISSNSTLSLDDIHSGCDLVLELLSNEGLRLTAVESTSTIAKGCSSNQLSPDWIISSIETLCNFLSQSSRALRIGSLNAILSITSQSVFSSDENVLKAMANVGQVILNQGNSILNAKHGSSTTNGDSAATDFTSLDIICKILTNLVSLISIIDVSEFGVHLLNQITSSQISLTISNSILNLFAAIVQNSDINHIENIYNELSKPRQVVSTTSSTTITNAELAAKTLAVIITEGHLDDKIPTYNAVIQQKGEDFKWSLLILGNIGRLTKYNNTSLQPLYSELENTQRDENTRIIIGNTIGQIISNNVDSYLTDVLKRLQAALKSSTHLYLLIIREVVSISKQEDVEKYAPDIWTSLFNSLESASSTASSSRPEIARRKSHASTSTAAAGLAPESSLLTSGGDLILSECLGRLAILNPKLFLPQLQTHLTSSDPAIRLTVLTAVKYTFGQTHDTYDDLLRPIIADFLALVDDNDLDIRQVALSALVSAIHNKSHLLLPHLNRLLPLLYRETTINKKLIHSVQMGPFKHKVDDGLELRKTAYETIYTLVSTLTPERLQSVGMIDELLDQVVLGTGLSDEHDIKVLSCVIVGRLSTTCLSNVTARLRQIITRYSALLNVVVKENAIKQEFEKHNEIVRNIERSSMQINDAINTAIAKGDTNSDLPSDVELGEWEVFFRTNILPIKFS